MGYEVCMENCESSTGDWYDMMEQQLMHMTMWAHKSILFEKIKAQIEQEEGKKLDQIATLLVAQAKQNYESEKITNQKHEELREKLRNLFE